MKISNPGWTNNSVRFPAQDGSAISSTGWLDKVQKIASPNFNQRPDPKDISLVVVHGISLPPDEFGGGYVQQFFKNELDFDAHPAFEDIRGVEVSSHFLIERDGTVTQFVSVFDRAWHAGQSCHQERDNCNDYSIGIELEGTDTTPYTEAQYQKLAELIKELMICFPKISSDNIVGHSDVAPGRKTDPGPAFEWPQLLALLDK